MGEFQPQLFASLFSEQRVPELRGGTAVVNLVRAYLEQGLPVDVLTLDPKATESIVRLKSDRLNIWIVKRRPSKAVRDGFRQECRLIEKVLQESDADICHAHWTYEYGMAAVTQKIKPFVVTVHDHARNILLWQGWRYAGLYLLTQFVLRKATGRLTAVSPYVAEYAERVSGRPVPVIPNVLSVDSSLLSVDRETSTTQQLNNVATKLADRDQKTEGGDQRTEAQKTEVGKNTDFIVHSSSFIVPESYPILITLADWGRLKNGKRALAAFSKVRKQFPDAQYRLIGAGLEQGGPAHRWAVRKRLTEGVRFCGWMPYDQAIELLHSSTVLFHPSLEESFGYPVAEALAAGIPVVASKQAGGAAWLLAEGRYGVLTDGRSDKAMAKTLFDVLNTPESVQEKSKLLGQEHIQALCNGSAVLAQYQAAYL
jgi:glycosyltransferase involved in cell wall biosynthesis